jgi:hypothetical protein
MHKKTGRNELCPCGSKLKYKKCHGSPLSRNVADPSNTNSIIPNFKHEGIEVTDNTVEEGSRFHKLTIGSPGIKIFSSVITEGEFVKVQENPEQYYLLINADIPALLPLEDSEPYPVIFHDRQYVMFHKTKTKGEEFFSTLETNKLPYFSSLQFKGELFTKKGEELSKNREGFQMILESLKKINSLLEDELKLEISDDLILSYHIFYIPKFGKGNLEPIARTTVPYNGIIDIKAPSSLTPLNVDKVKSILTEKFKIESYSKSDIEPKARFEDFSNKVFISIHDFAFYCSQHPESLQSLDEELLRDLYLILAKVIFVQAEGETFHFDGKLDFKITNIENRYEFINGELKWWTGDKSFREAFHQAVRKHVTGQESCIYILMLNKNKNRESVIKKIKSLISSEVEYVRSSPDSLLPEKSRQFFEKHLIMIRGYEVPIIVGLVDCYYERM